MWFTRHGSLPVMRYREFLGENQTSIALELLAGQLPLVASMYEKESNAPPPTPKRKATSSSSKNANTTPVSMESTDTSLFPESSRLYSSAPETDSFPSPLSHPSPQHDEQQQLQSHNHSKSHPQLEHSEEGQHPTLLKT